LTTKDQLENFVRWDCDRDTTIDHVFYSINSHGMGLIVTVDKT